MIAANTESANHAEAAANDADAAANDTAVAANDVDAAANHAVPLAANQSDISSSASVNTNVSVNTHARSGSSGGCLGSVLSGVGKFFGGLFLIGFIVVLYKLGIVKH